MTKRTLLVLALCLPAADAFAAPGSAADIAMVSAYLGYPTNGAVDVPGNTLVFGVEVTAVQLQGPDAQAITALLDPSHPSSAGAVFEPMQVLSPGAYRVLGVPSTMADNYAGPGVPVDLGTFTVGDALDEEPPSIALLNATWTIGGDNDISVSVSLGTAPVVEPTLFEIDLGDADTLRDGQPDGSSSWVQSTAFGLRLGETVPQIDPETASVRVRAMDAAGNVGDWSAPTSFALFQSLEPAPGCAAAPGASEGREGLAVLLFAAVALGVSRARRR